MLGSRRPVGDAGPARGFVALDPTRHDLRRGRSTVWRRRSPGLRTDFIERGANAAMRRSRADTIIFAGHNYAKHHAGVNNGWGRCHFFAGRALIPPGISGANTGFWRPTRHVGGRSCSLRPRPARPASWRLAARPLTGQTASAHRLLNGQILIGLPRSVTANPTCINRQAEDAMGGGECVAPSARRWRIVARQRRMAVGHLPIMHHLGG